MEVADGRRTDTALAGSGLDSQEEFRSLVADHSAFIWRLLRRLGLSPADADDASQQVFMIAARKIKRIEPDRARPFLYGVALRVARNAKRGLERQRSALGGSLQVPCSEPAGPEQLTQLARAQQLLDELLEQLPNKLRRVLVLVEIEQLEVAEVAALERIPVGTAASRLRLARRRFGELLSAVAHRNPFGEPA